MRSCAAPPAHSSSAKPQVRNMVALKAISTVCWQCHTDRAGVIGRPSISFKHRLATTSSTCASCAKRGDSCLSTMRGAPDPAGSTSIIALSCGSCAVCAWAASSEGRSTLSPSSSWPLSLLTFISSMSAFVCIISRSNSKNHEPSFCPSFWSSSGWSPEAMARTSLSFSPKLPSSPSSHESSPTFSPASRLLYHCSCARSKWKILLAIGVSPTLSGCHVLKRRRMTAL
mmetsp:Transcript_11786/g.31967  ORF Transcript_11786/g.31967 Transcript_11786/m.31967 type:complete len:228 (+) Transcript_11786:653-1336(+)